ncbi:murein hydrolase activator EnvC family protein [Luteimonas sp. e5]
MKPAPRALAACLALALVAVAGKAQDTGETERKLRELRKELRQIGSERRKLEGERGAATRAVRDADETVARSARALAETRNAIDAQQARLTQLQTQRRELQTRLAGQREELARLVRAAYLVGSDAPLKVLLSQDQVARGNRDLVLYGALQRDRARRIREIGGQLAELTTLEEEITRERTQLAQAQQRQQQELAELERQRQERGKVLAQVDAQYKDKASREKALGQDARALERVLAQLRAAAARAERERRAAAERARREQAARERAARNNGAAPAASTPAPRVARAAPVAVGGAGWPLSGSLLAGFGGTMPDGSASSGLLIAAAAGAPVRAVADGQVVFAEWMSGYGLLAIVDHGNGYMSLYAHNDALMKDVGATVKRGDVLGSVGNSGGQGQPALYFELRRAGKPVNPSVWLKR